VISSRTRNNPLRQARDNAETIADSCLTKTEAADGGGFGKRTLSVLSMNIPPDISQVLIVKSPKDSAPARCLKPKLETEKRRFAFGASETAGGRAHRIARGAMRADKPITMFFQGEFCLITASRATNQDRVCEIRKTLAFILKSLN